MRSLPACTAANKSNNDTNNKTRQKPVIIMMMQQPVASWLRFVTGSRKVGGSDPGVVRERMCPQCTNGPQVCVADDFGAAGLAPVLLDTAAVPVDQVCYCTKANPPITAVLSLQTYPSSHARLTLTGHSAEWLTLSQWITGLVHITQLTSAAIG